MSYRRLYAILFGLFLMSLAVGASVAMAGETELMLIGPNSNVAQKAKIVGNTLMLLGQNGKWATAPEGTYRAMDGGSKEIIVQRGVIVPGIVSPENAPVPMRREKNVPPPKEGTAGDALRRGMQQAR